MRKQRGGEMNLVQYLALVALSSIAYLIANGLYYGAIVPFAICK
jgi:hypothetical protein